MRGAGHREIEIKLRVSDLRLIRARLRQIGARPGKRVHEVNTLYDSVDGKLRRRGELLRLRFNDGAAIMTFKGPAQRSRGGAGRYKVRQESEFAVGSLAAIRMAMRHLGFVPGFRYEKYRTSYQCALARGVEIVLDETPVGHFLELEGPPRAIDRVARLLGFRPRDYLTASYGALYAADCLRRGRQPGHMLFPRRKMQRKTSVLR
jgi:adenylate cyclase class 2